MYPPSVLQPAEVLAVLPLQLQHENPYPRYCRGTDRLTAYSIAPTLHATISVAFHATKPCYLHPFYSCAPCSYHTYHPQSSRFLQYHPTNSEDDLPWVLSTTKQAEMMTPEGPEEEGVVEFPQSPARFLTPPQTTLDGPTQRTRPLRYENAQLS